MITSKEFMEQRYKETNWSRSDMCPPPTDAQYCMDLMFKIAFGEGVYEPMPISPAQINTETMQKILRLYEEARNSWFKRILLHFVFNR